MLFSSGVIFTLRGHIRKDNGQLGHTDSLWEEINERNKASHAFVKLTQRELTKVSTLWLCKRQTYRLS